MRALTQDKYKKAIIAENTFKIGDRVRYMRNKALFEKGTTTAKWSATIHNVVEKNGHSYLLDNNRTYKYYELLPVQRVETMHMATTRRKAKEPTKEQLKKTNTSRRRLKREGLAVSNMLNSTRIRAPTNRFTY